MEILAHKTASGLKTSRWWFCFDFFFVLKVAVFLNERPNENHNFFPVDIIDQYIKYFGNKLAVTAQNKRLGRQKDFV